MYDSEAWWFNLLWVIVFLAVLVVMLFAMQPLTHILMQVTFVFPG